MEVKYKLKKRFEENGIIIRGIFGPINKDTLNERVINRICSMGLAEKFLERIEDEDEKGAKNDSKDALSPEAYSLSDSTENVPQDPLKYEIGDVDETQEEKPKRKRRKKNSGE